MQIQKNRLGFNGVWTPTPTQKLALTCPATVIMYGGAAGGGKSAMLPMFFYQYTHYGKDWRGVIFRKKESELEDLKVKTIQLLAELGGGYNTKERCIVFESGSRLYFRHLMNENEMLEYKGWELPYIAFDEITHWDSDKYLNYLLTRNRSTNKLIPRHVLLTCNPEGPGVYWVKKRFIDNRIRNKIYDYETIHVNVGGDRKKLPIDQVFIPAYLTDNPHLTENDPTYIGKLFLQSPATASALLKGDWNFVEGQAFPEWSYDVHTCVPMEAPIDYESSQIGVVMDWGYNSPFCILWYAYTRESQFIIFKEWYGANNIERDEGIRMPSGEVARKALSMSRDVEANTMIADPSCWNKTGASHAQDEVPSVAETFRKAGWNMLPANNDRKAGKLCLHELLQGVTKSGKSRFQVWRTCKVFIDLFPTMITSVRNPEDVEEGARDHVYDTVRYGAAAAMMEKAIQNREILYAEKQSYIDNDNDMYMPSTVDALGGMGI